MATTALLLMMMMKMSVKTPLTHANLDRGSRGGRSTEIFHSAEQLHGAYLVVRDLNKLSWGCKKLIGQNTRGKISSAFSFLTEFFINSNKVIMMYSHPVCT